MSRVIEALREHARADPDRVAIDDGVECLSYAQLLDAAQRLADRLTSFSPRMIGLLADNGVGWVVTDLAAMLADVPITPLPLFASTTQISHVLRSAGIDCVVTDRQDRLCEALPARAQLTLAPMRGHLLAVRLTDPTPAAAVPERCWKVTFTSGTTAEPKGVCLARDAIERTAEALRQASAGTDADRHLCVLPLATLLENIGGVYAPLLAGATACVPPLSSLGFDGSSRLDIARLLAALHEWRATSAIVVPQILAAMVAAIGAGAQRPRELRFLAVGGAALASGVLEGALALGLPVHEGYGLSECASVVAVNRPGACRPGSVGQPLPHLRVELARDGEIIVHGDVFLGYLGDGFEASRRNSYATGDIGYFDEAGYLHVTGRKRNVFITSFGRNVAPEWVESELVAQGSILQAAVFGEARPFNAAVIVPRASATEEAVSAAVDRVNEQLPDYARVGAWIVASEPFSSDNGQSTPNGRPRREAISKAYAAAIESLYQPERASSH
jgi:long-chain acyl-CoA synthetase